MSVWLVTREYAGIAEAGGVKTLPVHSPRVWPEPVYP